MLKLNLVPLVCFLLLIVTGCDQGRVIDEDERRKVLTRDGVQKASFEGQLQIRHYGSTPQSEPEFYFYDGFRSRFLGSIKFSSLLTLDLGQDPVLNPDQKPIRFSCVNRNPQTNACAVWSNMFDLKDLFSGAPTSLMKIEVYRFKNYKLFLRQKDQQQVLAEYETFRFQFSWSGLNLTLYAIKHQFATQQDLIPGFGWKMSWPKAKEEFSQRPFADLLYFTLPYFPSPSNLLRLHAFEQLDTHDTTMEVQAVFKSVLTGEFEKYRYVVEQQ